MKYKTKEEIFRRLCNITVELSDIYYENRRASVDMFGNRRESLSSEWVFFCHVGWTI